MTDQPPITGSAVFRVTPRAYLTTALFAGFFVLMGVLLRRETPGSWPVLAVAGLVTLYLFAALAARRFELNATGLRYRELFRDRVVGFANVERARFETTVNRAAPLGVAAFWIHPKDGKPLKVDLRLFPPRGTAELFAALERHRIPIAGADTLAARRMLYEASGGAARPRRGR